MAVGIVLTASVTESRDLDIAQLLQLLVERSNRVEQPDLASDQRFQMLLHGLKNSRRRLRSEIRCENERAGARRSLA